MLEKWQIEKWCNPALAAKAGEFMEKLRTKTLAAQKRIEGRIYTPYALQEGDRLTVLPGVSRNDLTTLAIMMAFHHVMHTGIKIIEVSRAEAELYEQTDLSGVDVQDWRQSYPFILVDVPDSVPIGVLATPEIKTTFGQIVNPLHMLAFPTVAVATSGTVDHVFVSDNVERAIVNITLDVTNPTITTRTGRIAVNAVLHLANYPDLYAHIPNANNRIKIKRQGDKGEMKKQVLIPQVIRPFLSPSNPKPSSGGGNGTGEPTGRHVRPHYRRGHWKRVVFGEGRSERKYKFIKPLIVHRELVVGGFASPTRFKDANPNTNPQKRAG